MVWTLAAIAITLDAFRIFNIHLDLVLNNSGQARTAKIASNHEGQYHIHLDAESYLLAMKRQSINFTEARSPIQDVITKFGGQPVWIGEPQWPISKSTGRPMRFMCQIALSEEIFGRLEPRMAYVFMTDEEDHVDGTWDPDAGENAVILQPGIPTVTVQSLATGPTLYRMAKKMFSSRLVPEACEFTVSGPIVEDPEFVPESERRTWTEEEWKSYADALDGNKIGGTPIFMQGDEFPGTGSWRLILELDSTRLPFSVNFGDAGIGYVFLSQDGKTGKFLWQCS